MTKPPKVIDAEFTVIEEAREPTPLSADRVAAVVATAFASVVVLAAIVLFQAFWADGVHAYLYRLIWGASAGGS